MPASPPTKFTKFTKDRLLEAKAKGAADRHCCDYAMITQTTLIEWKNLAKAQKERGEATEYTEFFDKMQAAYASNGLDIIEKIRTASNQEKHWTAGAWLLERQYRQDYGRSELPPEEPKNGNTMSAEERLKRVNELLNSGGNSGT